MADIKSNTNSGRDILQEFQLAQLTTSQKESPEIGKQISKKIWGYTNVGVGGYFYNRNAQFVINRNYANGIMNVQEMFQDRFQFNAKQNYIRLDWQTLQIVNRIISGLVGRWMQRGEKIIVTATDDLSQKNKKEQYDQLEFIIENRRQLEELQKQSGVQMIPNDEIPADKDELMLWKAQFQRLPEEIENELGCNEVLASNSMYDVVKEKLLHDSAEVGFVGTYAWMDEQGIIHNRWVKPEDSIYGWSEYPDFRDSSWLGEAPSIKISELRRDFGKEFHPDDPLALNEEDLFKIAQTAKEWSYNTNLVWTNAWNTLFMRPYDEWNVRSVKFELRTVDKEPYTITKSTISDRTYTQKGYPVNKKGEPKPQPSINQEIIDDSNINIYESVYLPDNDKLLRWRLKKNMIRPQDPKEIGNAEFSYSFYMYQNYLMRNLAVPQKIQAAVDGMILALLKVQQDVSLAIPPGWVIDETALQAIDYGLGDQQNKSVDHARLFFQTGKLWYRGLDGDGNRVPPPIEEIANTGFSQHIEAFMKTYQFWYQTLKDELGEDPNLITAAVQPRVAAGNVEVSQQSSEQATDYIYRAYAECMKMTSRKNSCLLKDSITYGSKAYRNIVKHDYTTWQIFSTDIKFLPTEQDILKFEAMMNQAIAASPDLLMFVNPFMLIQMAKEDVKLSWLMFDSGRKKMLMYQIQQAKENQDATFKAQQASAITSETQKRMTMKQEVGMKGKIEYMTSKEKQKEIILTGIFGMREKGVDLGSWSGVEQEMVRNVGLPLFAENVENEAAFLAAIGAEDDKQEEEQPQDDGMQQNAPQETSNMQQPQIQSQQPQQMVA